MEKHSEEPVAGKLHGGFCEGRTGVIRASTRHYEAFARDLFLDGYSEYEGHVFIDY